MSRRPERLLGVILFATAFAAGCPKPAERPGGNDEEAVREAVSAFQAALKARDADKLWQLLDADSRADADRAAQAVRDAYARAGPEQKAEQEKALGLPGAELAALTGTGFLKTKRFHGKYDELPDSTIDKVTVQGDQATVAYTEPDGDKEKLTLVREEGKWKVSVPMPKAGQP
jgi:hypothetical protein